MLSANREVLMSHPELANAIAPSVLRLFILPTEHCNFRCTYCYEDFSIGRMRQDVVEGIENLLKERCKSLKHLQISWFGGEPLLAKGLVFRISEYANALASEYGINFYGDMTTNGFRLTKEVLEKLVLLKQAEFQISLDGDRDAHNLTRRRIDGSATFDVIWRNLLEFATSDLQFTIVLRLHLSPDNLSAQERLISQLNEALGQDQRYAVFFHKVCNLGGPGSKNVQPFDRAAYNNAFEKLRKQCKLRVLGNENTVEKGRTFSLCYASMPNSLVIRPDGRIAKCTVAFSDPRNTVGQLMPDGRVKLDTGKIALWVRGLRTLDRGELHCPLISLPMSSHVCVEE